MTYTQRDDAGMVYGRDYALESMPLYREYMAAIMSDESADATRDVIKDSLSLDYTPTIGDDIESATTYTRYMTDAYTGTDDDGMPLTVNVSDLMRAPWALHTASRLTWRIARDRMQAGARPRATRKQTLNALTHYAYKAPRRNNAIRSVIIREVVTPNGRILVKRMTADRIQPLASISHTFEQLDAMRAVRDAIKADVATVKRIARQTSEDYKAQRNARLKEQRAQLRAMRAEAESRMTIAEAIRDGVRLPSE